MQAGDVIADRFEIEHLAGRGGMGSVYAAVDRLTGGRVALKLLHELPELHGHVGGHASRPHEAARADAFVEPRVERFLREARVLAELDHPAFVRHVAHGTTPDGRLYLAMEWLEGEDLASRLRGGRLPVQRALDIVARAADAVGVIHARGIVHRDIKPSNLFLVGDDVRVIDFGIARFGAVTAMTRTGTTLGTIGYMAPEQASGALEVDARADVFALGCVLFECLTGRVAFAGAQMVAVLTKVLFEDPPRPSDLVEDIAPAIDELVGAMLAKAPEQRPGSGAELARAIRSLGNAQAARTPSLTRGEQRGASVVLAVPRPGEPARSIDASTVDTLGDPRQLLGTADARVAELAGGAMAIVIAGAGHGADHARQAAKAALSLAAARPEMALAVVTGRAVIAGAIPVGEAIDRAARLVERGMQEARATIWVDDVTAGLLEMRFEIEGGELRGERAFEDTRTLLGKRTPLVGRERELQFLSGLADECVNEPVARAVLVTAPPGVGKSRLCRELVGRLDTRHPAIRVMLARGDSLREGSTFGVLTRALESAFAIRGGDSPDVARHKVQTRVEALLGGSGRETAELLGEIMGLPFPDDDRPLLRAARQDPAVMGDRMRRAWLAWLAAECDSGPLAFLVEDLHWGDLPSVNYLDAALASLHDRPLFVIATARPEIAQVFPSLWSRHELQELKLGSLTRGASVKLARGVLGAIADEDVDRIVARASGNAFFLEELIRAYAEGKTADTPETVRAIVRARLEELPPNARQVLRAASIYGEVCWRAAVEALLGAAQRADELDRNLAVLVDREILQRRASGRFADELVFRHAFVRDAAYDMLTDDDRVLGHRLAGEWLEDHGERDAMTLAEHFERGRAPERAIRWYKRAATQALEGNDLVAVLQRAERGIACGASGDALGALRLLQAQAHDWRGENVRTARAATEALAELDHGSDAWFEAACEMAVACRRIVEVQPLREIGRAMRVLDTVEVASSTALRTTSRVVIQLTIAGAVDDALVLRDAIDRREPWTSSDPMVRVWAKAASGIVAMIGGDPSVLVNAQQRMIDDVDATGDRRSGCNIRLYLGIAARETGAFELAVQRWQEAITTADALGIHTMSATIRTELASTLAKLGRLDEALPILESAPAIMREQNDRMQEFLALAIYATTLLAMGEHARALEQAELALSIRSESSPFRPEVVALRSHALRHLGRAADALVAAQHAMDLLESHRGLVDLSLPSVLHARAEARRVVGDVDGARSDVVRACAVIRDRAMRFVDAAHREYFVTRVLDHAKLLALEAELGTVPPPTSR